MRCPRLYSAACRHIKPQVEADNYCIAGGEEAGGAGVVNGIRVGAKQETIEASECAQGKKGERPSRQRKWDARLGWQRQAQQLAASKQSVRYTTLHLSLLCCPLHPTPYTPQPYIQASTHTQYQGAIASQPGTHPHPASRPVACWIVKLFGGGLGPETQLRCCWKPRPSYSGCSLRHGARYVPTLKN